MANASSIGSTTLDPQSAPEPLTARVERGATICPVQKTRMEAHVQHLGVFTSSGSVIETTLGDRHHGTHTYQAADLSIYDQIADGDESEVIYAGMFFHHYGHFLLESLARLWYAKQHPELTIVWVGVDSWPSPPQLRPWQKEILSVLGVRNPTRVLTRPERFSSVHVPDAGYKYADWCHPQQATFLAAFDEVEQVPGRKIWLSRSDVANGIGIVNSPIIEKGLRESGWTLISPETLPIREQLRAFAEAEEIAGEEGSAFHTLLLLKDISRKKFHVFRRHGREHLSFHTIGRARQVVQNFYSTGRDALISLAGRDVQRIAPNASHVLDSLQVPVRRAAPRDALGHHSARRVNEIIEALGARTYLQIGVQDGRIFNAIRCEKRVAVDTEFHFDVRNFEQPDSEFYALTPGDYATYFGAAEKFDVIFLNDCHFVEEIMTTIAACLPLTHAKTVFLVDNVFPIDEFSAMRDKESALRLREAEGSSRKAWHGDAYKAIFLINELYPLWDLSIINTGGNSQAIVRGPGHRVKYVATEVRPDATMSETLQAADLSYHDFVARRQELVFISEEAAVTSLRSLM